MIHPTAVVHESALLGTDVEIGAYSMVGAGAVLGDRCRLESHAVVRDGCQLGVDVFVDSFCVIGGDAQMRGANPTAAKGRVLVGDRVVLREGVTLHRPVDPDAVTSIGDDCYFMAQSHAAHDCKVGEHVTLANGAMLDGHVEVFPHCFIGGGAGVHQFVRVGEGAMVAGNAAISYDVPPFCVAADRNDIVGLNFVGLRRGGVEPQSLVDLKECFRIVVRGEGNLREEAARMLAGGVHGTTSQGRLFLEFFVGGKRGFGQSRRRRARGVSQPQQRGVGG
jgi:UDP-N-acetylglucosamine acyltransferase